MSLRRFLNAFSAALTAAVLVVAAALLFATTRMRQATDVHASALQSVRAAEEIEVALLLHAHAARAAHAPIVPREDARADVARWTEIARSHVGSADEAKLLSDLEEKLRAYFAAEARGEPDAGALLAAVAATERLLEQNLNDAQAAHAVVLRLDRASNRAAIALAGLILALVLVLLAGVRRMLFRPLSQVSAAMRRFGHGDPFARVPRLGPSEMQQIGATFNTMADRLARQREIQLASLAAIAHDLRTPLTALKLAADAARRQRGTDPTRFLAVVARQVDQLDRMVSDLMDGARIEGGQVDLHLSDRDLRELVQQSAELFRGASQAHTLAVEVPDGPLSVRCDPARVAQILNNLISNALKYSPGGGPVRLRAWSAGGWAYLSVQDPGIGIAPEERERLFEPFHRSSNAHAVAPGVGLGLSVVRRLALAHGGSVHVESQLGRGSTFTVRLPLSTPSTSPPSPAPVKPKQAEPDLAGFRPPG